MDVLIAIGIGLAVGLLVASILYLTNQRRYATRPEGSVPTAARIWIIVISGVILAVGFSAFELLTVGPSKVWVGPAVGLWAICVEFIAIFALAPRLRH